jgi:hypothetical protein
MTLYTRGEAGKVLTPFQFSDGKPLEFVLSADGSLSDQGRAYDAVGLATVQCGFIADVYEQWAKEIIPGFGVQYQHGVFYIDGVTEDTVEEAVIKLVNVVLLFYGMGVGACPAREEDEE